MIIKKEYSKRSGHFLKIEFDNNDEYENFINTLSTATHCLIKSNDERIVQDVECLARDIERFKQVSDSGRVTSVIWQKNMLTMFGILCDMSNLIVSTNRENVLCDQIISNYQTLNSQHKEIVELMEKENNMLRQSVLMHKTILKAVCDDGFVLDDKGKSLWYGDLSESLQDDVDDTDGQKGDT